MRCLGEAHYVFTCISIFMSELFIDYFIWFLHKIFHEKNVRNPFSARFGRQYRSISTKTRLDVALIQSPYSCHIYVISNFGHGCSLGILLNYATLFLLHCSRHSFFKTFHFCFSTIFLRKQYIQFHLTQDVLIT